MENYPQPMELSDIQSFESLFEKSLIQPVLLFKYSPVCPVSHYAEKQFEIFIRTQLAQPLILAKVDVIESRPVARGLVSLINLKHESPQAILLLRKKVVWYANHSDITVESLSTAVDGLN